MQIYGYTSYGHINAWQTYIYAYLGTFAKTAIIAYRLSFADQRNKTSVFRFRLQQTKERLPFPFSVCSIQTKSLFSFSLLLRLQKQSLSFQS